MGLVLLRTICRVMLPPINAAMGPALALTTMRSASTLFALFKVSSVIEPNSDDRVTWQGTFAAFAASSIQFFA